MRKNKEEKAFGVDHYMPIQWFLKLTEQNKLETMESTSISMLEAAKSAPIKVVFRGKQINIAPIDKNCESAKIVIDEHPTPKIHGRYSTENNTISVNPDVLNDGKMSCETITHETSHQIEAEMKKMVDLYPQNSLEWEFLKLLEYGDPIANKKINTFGIAFEGTMYISGLEFTISSIDAKSKAFYALAPTERHAYLTGNRLSSKVPGEKESNDLEKNPLHSSLKLSLALRALYEEYDCFDRPIDEVFKSIDNAQTFIAFGYGLTNDFEANLAYDMAAIMEYENSELSHDEKMIKLNRRFDASEKARALGREGYVLLGQEDTKFGSYVVLNDMPVTAIDTLEKLKTISPGEQINNPMAIVNFIIESEIDPRDVLHYPDALDEWLFSKDSLEKLPTIVQHELEKVLGEEFSVENRKRIAEIKELDSLARSQVEFISTNNHNSESLERGFVFESLEEDVEISGR